MEKGNSIERNTDPKAGPLDGVTLQANAVITKFRFDEGGKKEIDTLEPVECKLMASYENGTVSFSIPEQMFMVTGRIDEMMALLMEAAKTASKYRSGCEKAATD